MTEPEHETPDVPPTAEAHAPAVRVTVDDSVAAVELDRPHRRNALSPRLREELLAAVTRIADDEGVRAVVLTGAGGHFCAGADLKELDVQRLGAEMAAFNRLIPALRALPQPVIARVQGNAVGAGCNLALACDLVVAGESARFAQVFPRLGLSVDLGGSWILPRLVGPHRARELALLGNEVDGRAAADMGLINRCVPDALLDDTVSALARQLAGYSPAAQARTKQLLEAALTGTLHDALDREAEAQVANAATTYFDTAVNAFRTTPRSAFMTREAVIVDAVRTPVGKRGGWLRDWHPTDLLAHTLSTLAERTGIAPEHLSDVIVGCALQRGEQAGNVARNALLGAGLPIALPGTTLDRQCGSGQQAVHFAAQGVKSGEYDFAVGAGVESMSRVDLGPLFSPNGPRGDWYGERALARFDGNLPAQGPSAELVIKKWGFTREQLDAYSIRSHQRAAAATTAGYFGSQLVPLDGTNADGTRVAMTQDEGIRGTVDPERVAALTPVFATGGAITAGNASQMSDGAGALLLAERSAAESAGLRPRARIVSMAVAADDPILQFTAIVPASQKALDQAGLTVSDIDLVEVNEAFAPVPLLWAQEFGYPEDQLNVNGGSIAIGHPLGSTGARLLTQLINELERREARYGLLTICEGGGMANATIIERI